MFGPFIENDPWRFFGQFLVDSGEILGRVSPCIEDKIYTELLTDLEKKKARTWLNLFERSNVQGHKVQIKASLCAGCPMILCCKPLILRT